MTKKLTCTVTGNWSYVSDERFAKLAEKAGGENELIANHISREGQKVKDGKIEMPTLHKNKIPCSVTGELMFCSDERMEKLIAKGKASNPDFSEMDVRAAYISRVARRLRKEKAIKADIAFEELDDNQRADIDFEIRELADLGNLPAASAPKGSKQIVAATLPPNTEIPPENAEDAENSDIEPEINIETTHSETGSVKETTPTETETETIDPLRMIDGESKKERKNRIRRERAAIAAQA